MDALLRKKRIIVLARILDWSLLALAVLFPLCVFWSVNTMPVAQLAHVVFQAPVSVGDPSRAVRLVVTGLAVLPALIFAVGILRLRGVVAGLRQGQPFVSSAFVGLRRFAIAVMASTCAGLVAGPLSSVLLTLHQDQKQLALSLSLNDVQMFVFALAIWLLSWLMAEGHALASENAQFV